MLLRYAQIQGVIILDICEEGDAIMADKGFLIFYLCTIRSVSLIIPPFKKQKKRFLPHHVKATKTIANLRIHVEREMKGIKNVRVLTGVMPITMASQARNLSPLTNLSPPLVKRA